MCGAGDFVFPEQQGGAYFRTVEAGAPRAGECGGGFLRNGEVRVDSDFYSVTRDVYLSLYNEDMYFMYGRLPHGFSTQSEFSDGELRTIRDGTMEWYVYDMSVRLSSGDVYYIRGVTSVTNAEESFSVTIRFAMFILPLMVAATAVIGYRFTRRTLFPVRQITETVQEIRADADLSRRIALPEGRGKQRDEIYVLADTFDGCSQSLRMCLSGRSGLHPMSPMSCGLRSV